MNIIFEQKRNVLTGYCKISHRIYLPQNVSKEDIRIIFKEEIKLAIKRKISDIVFKELSHNGELMLKNKKVRVSMFCPKNSIIIGDKTMESFILSDIIKER